MSTVSNTFGYRLSNPVVRKLRRKTDELAGASPRVATFSGIAKKTTYFLVLFFVGSIAYFVLHPYLIEMVGKSNIYQFVDSKNIFNFNVASYELMAFAGVSVISIFFPLIAWLIRPLIPVVGTIYALSQGYMIGFLTGNLQKDYQWIGVAAFGITVLLVAVMLILYSTGIARAGKKVRSILAGFFFTSILVGVLGFVLYIIPFTRPYMTMVDKFLSNPAISIALSCIGILIGTLFLLVDFNTIESCVTDRMPKKLEWMAAWGLAYTIIYIYLKVFNLLLKIVSAGKKD